MMFQITSIIVAIVLIFGTKFTISWNDITSQERELVTKLKEAVEDDLTEPWMKHDAYLLPFVRAQKHDLNDAKLMLKKSLQWRVDNRMNEILKEDFSKIQRVFPYYIDGEDKEGRPVVELPLGQWDVRRAVLSAQRPYLSRYLYQFMEKAATQVRQAAKLKGKDINQIELIMDINGYNIRSHGCINCFPLYIDFITQYEANYPQMARNLTVINCPRISEPLLHLLRNLMTPASAEALKIYGYNKGEWKDVVLESIAAEQLSPEFGGTKIRNSS